MPLPRKPTGQEPQDQEPSGKLLHSAPGKQGLDRQPSAGREETVRLAAAQEQHPVVASEMPAAEARLTQRMAKEDGETKRNSHTAREAAVETEKQPN